MPRQLRIQYPGAIYHVLSRGDRREKIFLDDVDRQDWHGKNRAERIIAEELATLSAPLLVSASDNWQSCSQAAACPEQSNR